MLLCASHGRNVDLGWLNLYSVPFEEISCFLLCCSIMEGGGMGCFVLD